jgi:CheY-like chemotaxis protein
MKPNLRILVVDDDQRMTHTLSDILGLMGYQVTQAHSAAMALDLVRSQLWDCVLSDVRMPGMDGVQLNAQIHHLQPGLPVLLMTAYASEELIRSGLEEGVVGVLNKPLDINHLLAFFHSLGKHRMIAIVDDDPVFCKTLGDILIQRGFNVRQITNPDMDVEQVTDGAQTILLDLKLDGVNGLDVLKNIRSHYPDLPVLLVTGYKQELSEIIRAGVEISAHTVFYKPLEIPELLQKLTEIHVQQLRQILKTA